jgi:6-phosphofructokinase 2
MKRIKMKNFDIVTLTINPALDKSANFSGLIPEQKIRCETPRYDAGGGGINVSKAISRLNGESMCIYTSGGPIGLMLQECFEKETIASQVILTKNWTRENFVAYDVSTQSQYRFGFPGAAISETEQAQIMATITNLKPKYLVISGSINEGLSSSFYQAICVLMKNSDTKIIVDTAGEALQKVLETGVYLIKPNIGELAKLMNVERLELNGVEAAAKKLIQNQSVEIVVVSLGPNGAILVTKDQTEFVAAPAVIKKSTVGAGDSMVGAMVWALSQNKSFKEVLKWGVSCGTAATMNEGTQLFNRDDAMKLFEDMK